MDLSVYIRPLPKEDGEGAGPSAVTTAGGSQWTRGFFSPGLGRVRPKPAAKLHYRNAYVSDIWGPSMFIKGEDVFVTL